VSFKDLADSILGIESVSPVAATPAGPGPRAGERPAAEPVAAAPVERTPRLEVTAPLTLEPTPAPPLTVETLVAGTAPGTAPASERPAAADNAKQLLTALPQEFENLKFPNDGVLTRQWMEFLNQMSGTK
jgi:hypothetical protein